MSVENKTIVINGSARSDGNTSKLTHHLLGSDIRTFDLADLDISHYRYDQNYPRKDDFMIIVDAMLDADLIILATPIYWYTMSGHMKIFMDRWTDLMSTYKPKGKALNGKKIGLIVQASSESMTEGFEVPIRLTTEYMDLQYIGDCYWDSRNSLPGKDSEAVLEVKRWMEGRS